MNKMSSILRGLTMPITKACNESWNTELVAFVNHGKTSPEWEDHMKHCETCEKAVDEVFDRWEKALHKMGRIMRGEESWK